MDRLNVRALSDRLNAPVALKWLLIAYVGSVGSAFVATEAIIDQRNAAKERRAQLCQSFRPEYRNDVAEFEKALNDYLVGGEYIASLSPRQARLPFNALIVKLRPESLETVAQSYQEVVDSVPPRFCGVPGDKGIPPVPERPAVLTD